MAFLIADRVKETTTTTGTGTVTLAGAVTGFQTFSAIGNTNTTTYCIFGVDANGTPTGEWETGIGTYTSSGTTLSRGVIKSSNSNALVNFSAGTKYVISTNVANYGDPICMVSTTTRAIQIADQTALSSTSGNARGTGAADFQIRRSGATQVASGNYSTISGGYLNTCAGTGAGVCSGRANSASNSMSVVAGGRNNLASGQHSFVGSGHYNTASATRSAVAGGGSNTASASFSGILCGLSNTVSIGYSAIGGGQSNSVTTSSHSFIGGGSSNSVTGSRSFIGGGTNNTASGTYSAVIVGRYTNATLFGQIAHGAGIFSAAGDAQTSELVVRAATTNNTQTEMFLNGSSLRLTIASDTSWGFECRIIARRTNGDNETSHWKIEGAIDNNAGTTALVGTITTTTIADDSGGAWTVTAEADNTNDALVFKVTGATSKNINWVGRVILVETTG